MSILLPAGRFETIQERSAGGLALIISTIFSGEGWGGIWKRDRLRGFCMASLVLSISGRSLAIFLLASVAHCLKIIWRWRKVWNEALIMADYLLARITGACKTCLFHFLSQTASYLLHLNLLGSGNWQLFCSCCNWQAFPSYLHHWWGSGWHSEPSWLSGVYVWTQEPADGCVSH